MLALMSSKLALRVHSHLSEAFPVHSFTVSPASVHLPLCDVVILDAGGCVVVLPQPLPCTVAQFEDVCVWASVLGVSLADAGFAAAAVGFTVHVPRHNQCPLA